MGLKTDCETRFKGFPAEGSGSYVIVAAGKDIQCPARGFELHRAAVKRM